MNLSSFLVLQNQCNHLGFQFFIEILRIFCTKVANLETRCMSEISFRTLRMVESSVSNSAARSSNSQSTAIEHPATSISHFRRLVYQLLVRRKATITDRRCCTDVLNPAVVLICVVLILHIA